MAWTNPGCESPQVHRVIRDATFDVAPRQIFMFYVYVLHSKKDNGLYIGRTDDLTRRISEHKREQVTSTKNRLPIELIFYEGFLSKKDSIIREEYLKSGYGRNQLRSLLKNLFRELNIK